MMRAAAHAVGDRGLLWITRPAVLGVTVLTSMDRADLDDVGITSDLRAEVVRLATLARDSGLDGIVASPHEIRLIRECITAERFIILTRASVRRGPKSVTKRIATPADAIRDGADFIVIGRAITDSPDLAPPSIGSSKRSAVTSCDSDTNTRTESKALVRC
jgi:orotidine-5'-phosphate decarboxylase